MQEKRGRGRPRVYDNPKQARAARNKRNREYLNEQIAAGLTRISLLVPRSDIAEFQQLAAVKRKLAAERRKIARPTARRPTVEKPFGEQEKAETERLWTEGYGLSDFKIAGMDLQRALSHLVEIGDVGSIREAMTELEKRDGAGPLKWLNMK